MGRTELNKYVFSLVGLSIVVLIGLVAVIMGMTGYVSGPRQTVGVRSIVARAQAPSPSAKARVKGFPNAVVADWGKLPASPSFEPPVRATLYALKQQYNRQEFANLAQHFISVAGNNVTETERSISVVTDKEDVGLFYMYKPTGTFFYRAKSGIVLAPRGQSEPEQVETFMRELWNDGTLQVTGSYAKRSVPGVRYYEIHRDWDRVGMPIVNLIGTFNIGPERRIGTMSVLKKGDSVSDTDIINTDDKTDGLARERSFNTASIGVASGRIVSVTSNIRPLAKAGSRSHGVIPYEAAVEKLRSGNYTHLYTSPAGDGAPNSTLDYDENAVKLHAVEVGESFTAYLEELPNKPQTQLYPYYLFRGTAMTDTGFRVKFIVSVPALSPTVLGIPNQRSNSLHSQRSGFNTSQQQGTFEFIDPSAASFPMVSQTPDYTPAPTANPRSMEELECTPPPSPRGLSNLTIDVGGSMYGIFHSPQKIHNNNEWYIIPGNGWNVDQLAGAVDKIVTTLNDDSAGLMRRMDRIVREFESTSVGCPVRIT